MFEAEVAVPGLPQPLHVFTAHLKSAQDAASSAKRAGGSGRHLQFFRRNLSSDERAAALRVEWRPERRHAPAAREPPQSIQRLISAPTGLHLATPCQPLTGSERTWSIQDAGGLTVRYDYILPCGLLFSNIIERPGFPHRFAATRRRRLYTNDNKIASDHLPVFMVFANPFNPPFRLLSIGVTNQIVSLKWESTSNRQYHVEVSSNLAAWTPFATNLAATGADFTFTTNVPGDVQFFRVRRAP